MIGDGIFHVVVVFPSFLSPSLLEFICTEKDLSLDMRCCDLGFDLETPNRYKFKEAADSSCIL